jgi:transposase-like protein
VADLQNPIFTDDDAAREALEAVRWPNGPVCPHCGCMERIAKVEGKKRSHRPGLYYCNDCKGTFTATIGTVFERSKIGLSKWWLACHLIGSSKKGMSAHQLHRMLGVTYKTAWFMSHRIREAMRDLTPSPMGGQNKVVEVDETYVGGKARNRKGRVPPKEAVVSLVERDGRVRSFHVATVTAKSLKPIVKAHVDRATFMMSDESTVYPSVMKGMGGHGTVNHSAEEYVRAQFWHTNTVENFFSIFKRGIYGTYHHVSPAHLHRYAAEFDFRHNHRSGIGYTDTDRCLAIVKGAEGKRLTYRRTAGGA